MDRPLITFFVNETKRMAYIQCCLTFHGRSSSNRVETSRVLFAGLSCSFCDVQWNGNTDIPYSTRLEKLRGNVEFLVHVQVHVNVVVKVGGFETVPD